MKNMNKLENMQEIKNLTPFYRLQSILSELIATTPPGERLPSEPELAKRLNASRATLREAMRSFEGQGLIRRRQGIGTFVVNHSRVLDTGLEVLESIETMAKKIQLDVSLDDVFYQHVEADVELGEKFNLPVGTKLIQISRIIVTDSRPVAYLIDLLPEDVLSTDELQDGFTGSVLDLLLKRGVPKLTESIAEIRAVSATPEIAKALQIQRNDVLQCFVASLFNIEGRMIDYSYSYFIPGVFRFHVVRKVGSNK
jgi:GntR family transcriptional regulator